LPWQKDRAFKFPHRADIAACFVPPEEASGGPEEDPWSKHRPSFNPEETTTRPRRPAKQGNISMGTPLSGFSQSLAN